MNDRFKFRTYIPDLKFFKYWGWIEEYHYVNMCACGDYSMPELLKNYTDQCTGLKDKNGKLIYESDIVKVINPKYETFKKSLQVLYFNGMYYLQNKRTLNPLNWFFDNSINYLEIVGNIYENFDLLDIKLQESEVK